MFKHAAHVVESKQPLVGAAVSTLLAALDIATDGPPVWTFVVHWCIDADRDECWQETLDDHPGGGVVLIMPLRSVVFAPGRDPRLLVNPSFAALRSALNAERMSETGADSLEPGLLREGRRRTRPTGSPEG